jgi:membrane-bound serine protease (ClpP class)
MLYVCIFLLVAGIIAILIELLMPGFDGYISGVLGLLAIIVSAFLAVNFVEGGWIFVGVSSAILFTAIFLMVTFIRRKQGRLILTENLAEDLPQIDLKGLLGKEGKTVTLLRPYGEVDFNGVRVEVCSDGNMVNRGAKVRVVDVQANKVIVNLVDGN